MMGFLINNVISNTNTLFFQFLNCMTDFCSAFKINRSSSSSHLCGLQLWFVSRLKNWKILVKSRECFGFGLGLWYTWHKCKEHIMGALSSSARQT